MRWHFPNALKLKRYSRFPLQVRQFYYCRFQKFWPGNLFRVGDEIELCLRLDSEDDICRDRINGRAMNVPFPNAVLKYPGDEIRLQGEKPRDVISFSYPHTALEILSGWKLLPPEHYWELFISPELEQKIAELRKLLSIYTTLPDAGDRLDAAAFQILREAVFCRRGVQVSATPENRIKKAALYLQQHYDQLFNMDEIAGRFGFSHAGFFRAWKQFSGIPPHQYLEQLKLKAAAVRLIQSDQTIAETAREVGFSGIAAFHRKFRQHFGLTPQKFRETPSVWKESIPDLDFHIGY